MPIWTSEVVPIVVAACREASGPLCASLASVLETPLTATVEARGPETDPGRAEPDREGLVLRFRREAETLLAVLHSSTGLLPEWIRQPDASQRQVLGELADTLGSLLLPGNLAPTSAEAEFTTDLAAELSRCHAGRSECWVWLKGGGHAGALTLFWPAGALLGPATDPASGTAGSDPERDGAREGPRSPAEPADCPTVSPSDLDEGFRSLPPYARSLLRILVPVKVTLAETRLPLQKILEMGPGSIIQFQKACEEALTLQVSDQVVAEGEAVKVGDKFGLWVTSIASPAERFYVMRPDGHHRRVV
jgi:flagellar motor switch/type III secretory pathway protein FliN